MSEPKSHDLQNKNQENAEGDYSQKFWELIGNQLGCSVPMYLRNLLKLRGFDSASSIKTLAHEDYSAMETFARSKMKKYLPRNYNEEDYFNIFSKEPEAFEILPGHIRLLDGIKDHIVEMTALHGPSYFDPASKIVNDVHAIRRSKGQCRRKVPLKVPPLFSSSKSLTQIQRALPLLEESNNVATSSVSKTLSLKGRIACSQILTPGKDVENDSDESVKQKMKILNDIKKWMEKKASLLWEKFSESFTLQLIEEIIENVEDELQEKKSLIFRCPICNDMVRITEMPPTFLSNCASKIYFSQSNVYRHFKNKHMKKDKTVVKPRNKKKVSTETSTSETDEETTLQIQQNYVNEGDDEVDDEIDDEVDESMSDLDYTSLPKMPKLRRF